MLRRLIALGLLVFLPSTELSAQQAPAGISLSCPMVPMVADGLLTTHMSFTKEDEGILKKVTENYAKSMDPTKVLLTENEFKVLNERVIAAAKALRTGDCSEFSKLHEDRIKWQEELAEAVEKIVDAKGYKVDKKATLELDVDKRKRPKTEKELAKLRRLIIDFQMANYIASDTKLEEAKTKLKKRYELSVKRLREQDQAEQFRVYLNAYATALDPHSTYFSPDDLEDFRIQMELSLTGIGAVLTSQDGYTVIQEIVVGGPAEQQGKLRPKDKIIAVAQGDEAPVDVIDMELRDVVKMIRGKKDTTVVLTVLRQSKETERFKVAIERDQIDLKDQAAKLEWKTLKRDGKDLKLAIIDLPSFYKGEDDTSRDCAKDMARLVEEARKGKADGILLDLSKNGGGVLQSAVEITGLFIESGPVVGVGVANAQRAEVLSDRDPRVQWDGPLVVMTSKVSASASEILAGALKDYNRAVIVGDAHTYGKGTVQQMTPLPAGLGLLKVTTAMFFLPAGQSTQNIGVEADIQIPSPLEPIDIGEKHLPYALAPAKTKSFATPQVNASNKWTPIAEETLKKLQKSSAARISKSSEFKELAREIKKSKAGETSIKIGDILKNQKSDEEAEQEGEKFEELRIQEASEILADLILGLK